MWKSTAQHTQKVVQCIKALLDRNVSTFQALQKHRRF